MTVHCDYCARSAEFVGGAAVYPHRPDLAGKRFYLCRPCGAWVGCHPGTSTPLGRLANASLRRAKQAAHSAFDPLWQHGAGKRSARYQWLAQQLGIAPDLCHIGMFDETMCARVVQVCTAAQFAR